MIVPEIGSLTDDETLSAQGIVSGASACVDVVPLCSDPSARSRAATYRSLFVKDWFVMYSRPRAPAARSITSQLSRPPPRLSQSF